MRHSGTGRWRIPVPLAANDAPLEPVPAPRENKTLRIRWDRPLPLGAKDSAETVLEDEIRIDLDDELEDELEDEIRIDLDDELEDELEIDLDDDVKIEAPAGPSLDRPTRAIDTAEQSNEIDTAGVSDGRRIALGTGSVIPGTAYRVRRWLGDGGMGVVFEAEHVDIERRVAVKVLHARSSRSKWITQAFRNEARASARIGSPNIVDVLDFKELEDHRLLIAMEFLDGITLRTAIEDEAMSWPRLIGIARQICKGLGAAHGAGIVHRDVKPENIMLVEREGRSDFVKLVDFGVAHFLRDEASHHFAGTAEYMAPEVLHGQSDERADIYAVGCVLYEMACAKPVFDSVDQHELMALHQDQQPTPPSERAPQRAIPSGLDAVVLRCLHKDPDARYQNMAELEAVLCELQIQHGWVTPWDHLSGPEVELARKAEINSGLEGLRAQRPQRPRWPRLLAAGAVLAVLMLLLTWSYGDTPAAQRDEIETLTTRAQAAAARFYFVYPPHDDPAGATAFREVLALEAIDHESAQERASELRQEFSSTLVRLGDRYWSFEAARPFALDYYSSALIFADDERARARTDLTVMALERLRVKASEGDFTDHELLASETLAALAHSDPQERATRLTDLQHQPVSVSVAQSIERVLAEGHPSRPRTMAKDRTARPLEPEPPAIVAPVPAAIESEAPEAVDIAPSQSGAAKTKVLVAKGEQALLRGDLVEAEVFFERVLSADRQSARALDGLGAIAFSRAEYAKSVTYLERAVALGRKKASRWTSLGDAYFKTTHYDDARQAYQRARDLGSDLASRRLAKLDDKLGM